MDILGYSLNAYTIPALVVSVGLIIDDMIVIRENIFRHIEEGMSPYDATIKGMKEMGDPVIGTTFMVFSVCLPLIVLRGSETGQYLENFGVAMFLSMAFSLLEAFTLGPLLCAYLLKPHVEEESHASRFQKSIDNHYDRALKWVHANAKLVLIFGVVVTFLGFVTPSFIRSEELPTNPTGSMEMRMLALQGIPLKVIQKKAHAFAQQLYHEYPDIRQIGLRVGSGNEMIFYIEMVEKKKQKITPAQLKTDLEKKGKALLVNKEIIGYFVTADITIPRSGYVPQYTLRLSSYNTQLLREYADKVFEELKNYNGLTNLAMSSRAKAQETSVVFDFRKMNRLGVITPPVVRELDLLLNGDEPVTYHPPDKNDTLKSEVKVKTELTSENADKLLKYGFVPNVNNTLIPFRTITGDISCDTSKQTSREDGEEYIEITADLNQEALNERPISYTEKIMEDKIPLPEGITPSWVGKAKKLKDMGKLQGQLGYLALFFIYTVLILIYRSLTVPWIILLSLPFSVAGSFFALFLTGSSVNLCSIIGIVLAIGIAAKNGIILVDYANQLIASGVPPTQAMDTACKIRLRPILMTSVGVFLTTIPVIIPWDDYSRLQIGLGIAVIGGLVTAMTLSLFLLPIIFKYTHHLHEKFDNAVLRHLTLPPDMKK
jgi:multidrug efflux pump subunit AcrB